MKPKVFIAKPVPKEVEAYISEYCDYRIWDKDEPIPRETLMEEISHVEGLMMPNAPVSKELLDGAPHLKVVSNISVGYDSFDTEEMKKRHVIGTNTPFVLDEAVADLTFGLMLSVSRRIAELNQLVKEGNWNKLDGDFLGLDVHHATLGIIGMGRIGEKIARRAALGFEMDVLYYNRTRRSDLEDTYGVVYSELDDLLKESDFVLVMLPLNEATHHFIGKDEFNKMKSSAFFINCSRGAVVDEQALMEALSSGKIGGAGLDVFEVEPIQKDNPLLQMKNVVTTPHMGSATVKTRFDMAMKAARNLVAGVTGETPTDVVPELKNLIKQ